MSPTVHPVPDLRTTFARPLRHLASVKGPFAKGMACILPANGLEFVMVFIVRDVLNGVTDGTMGLGQVAWWAAAVLVLAVVKGVAKFGMRWYVTGSSREIERRYRQELFDHLVRLSPADLAHVRTGDILSRSVADIEAVRMLMGPALMYNVQAAVTVPTTILVMAWIDPALTLAMLLPFAGLALVIWRSARPTQHWSRASQERLAQLSTVAQERFSGIRVVKAFAAETFSGNAFRKMGKEFLAANVRLATIRGVTWASVTAVKEFGFLVILLVGGWHLVSGTLTLGDFWVFLELLRLALWPLIAIGWMLGMFTRARAGAERLEELFAIRPSVRDDEGSVPPTGPAQGGLEVRHLDYSWNGRPVLHDICLTVAPGSVLGITGRTGCGKSTLVQILSRQVEPPPGTVLLDGRDVRELPLEHLRRSVGVVPQDAFLFSDTLTENIAFAGDHIGRDTVRRVAALAQVDQDIEGFPDRYEQVLGERGVTLSGGQRQRVTLARTLAADPPMLILDDCLSAVDSITERAILDELRDALRGRTAIIVSHRVAALSLADRIVVLDEGRVAEEGTHAELVARGDLYASIHERQRIEQELETL